MEKTILSVLFCFSVCAARSFCVEGKLVPALYVFGDSLNDAGNNNFIPKTIAKANYRPYGIDFPNGTSGRFTNGYTVADYLALSLGLHIPPPILNPSSRTTESLEGFNYASGSAGILSDTGIMSGLNLCLTTQVKIFQVLTAGQFLPNHLKTKAKISIHLKNSIFFVDIGANDYGLNYINGRKKTQYNPQQFADLLVEKLAQNLKVLYHLGARKFVVTEIGPIGSAPAFATNRQISQQINLLVSIYNNRLGMKMRELNNSTLKHATFVTMKSDFLAHVLQNLALYGFKSPAIPCCVVEPTGICRRNLPPCADRQTHVFFDGLHTSDAANKILANTCFNGTDLCIPLNLAQLAKKA